MGAAVAAKLAEPKQASKPNMAFTSNGANDVIDVNGDNVADAACLTFAAFKKWLIKV